MQRLLEPVTDGNRHHGIAAAVGGAAEGTSVCCTSTHPHVSRSGCSNNIHDGQRGYSCMSLIA